MGRPIYFWRSIYLGGVYFLLGSSLYFLGGVKNQIASLQTLRLKSAIPSPKFLPPPLPPSLPLPPPFAGGFTIFQQQIRRRSPFGRAVLQENQFNRLSPRLWATGVPGRGLQDWELLPALPVPALPLRREQLLLL